MSEHVDLGWTHIALPALDIDASIAFYTGYARLRVVHDRTDEEDGVQIRVIWLADGKRPFVLALVKASRPVEHPLGPFAHLGIAVESTAAVDTIAERARAEGRLRIGPADGGPTIGYFCFVSDPDGHVVEFSFGQEVGFAVEAGPGEA